MAEQLAVRGFGRASSSAQQSRLGERPFYTIILQRPLPDLGGQDPQVRFLCLGMPCTDKHIGLESRCMIPSRPSHALAPLFAAFSTTWVDQTITYRTVKIFEATFKGTVGTSLPSPGQRRGWSPACGAPVLSRTGGSGSTWLHIRGLDNEVHYNASLPWDVI